MEGKGNNCVSNLDTQSVKIQVVCCPTLRKCLAPPYSGSSTPSTCFVDPEMEAHTSPKLR